jgi:putative lipoprotein (rSAM/lipoprotein system)
MRNMFNNTHKKWLFSKRKIYYNILKVFGLCSACFLFEACYGSPQNEAMPKYNMDLTGTVKSQDSLKPIQNIKITLNNSANTENPLTATSSIGTFNYSMLIENKEISWTIKATDVDDSINGKFNAKETTFVFSQNEYENGKKNVDLLLNRE